MTSLNSYSINTHLLTWASDLVMVEKHTRVLGEKGIFIIPYDTSRTVLGIRLECSVVETVNETLTLWSNPEIGFYGYLHARYFKKNIGSPVQINQRSQTVFTWFPHDWSILLNMWTFLQFQAFIFPDDINPFTFNTRLVCPSPFVSDFSVGLVRAGKVQLDLSIAYLDPDKFPLSPLTDVIQELPNPDDVRNTDPNAFRDLVPDLPIDAPYDPETGDFGESVPGTPAPPEPLPASPFRVVWAASGPGFNDTRSLSFCYDGPQITSITRTPRLSAQGRYVLDVETVNGFRTIDTGRGTFVTLEQNQAFLETFTIIDFEPC